MMRAIRLLNLRRLARVRLRVVVAVAAVAAGSSLALSLVIVQGSTSYSLNRLTEQVAGSAGSAGIRIAGATTNGGITFEALAAAARTPGVQTVIPVVEAISAVRTSGSTNQAVLVIGVSCSGVQIDNLGCAAPPGGAATPSFTAIAPDLAKRLTHGSWVETDLGLTPLSHAVVVPALNSVNRGDIVVMPLAEAQRQFARHGRVDDLYVVPERGVPLSALKARLAKAVGPWDGVVSATSPPPEVSLALGAFTPILGLLAIVGSGIAGVLVYNVIALSLEERRRELAVVAAVGASPVTLIVGPFLEAAILGAIGGLLGTLGGVALANPILGSLSTITESLVGVPISEHATSTTFILGILVGAAIGVAAAIRPVVKSLRTDIAAEISGREQRAGASAPVTLRRALLYLSLAVGGAVLCWLGGRNGSLAAWQPTVALVGLVLALVMAIVALGAWAPVVVRGVWASGRLPQGMARLGIANLLREPGRTAVMSVAIGAAVAVAFITASYNRAVDQDIAASFNRTDGAHGVLVLTAASSSGFNVDGQIPTRVINALQRLPGVERIDQLNGLITGHSASQLVLVESDTHPTLTYWNVYNGTADAVALRRGEVMVGAALARRDHLRGGSMLTLDTPTGLARVKVQGVWSNGDGTGDNVTMSLAEQTRLFGPQLPPELALIIRPGVAPSVVVDEARRAQLGAYLKFETPSSQLSHIDNNIASQLAPFTVLQRALLLVSFITVLSTLLLVGIQRRRELGMMAAVGASPKDLFTLVLSEGLLVSVIAVVLGAAFGFGVLAVILYVTPLLVGYVDSYSPDLTSLVIYGPIAVVIALLAALWPGRQAARTPILESLRYE